MIYGFQTEEKPFPFQNGIHLMTWRVGATPIFVRKIKRAVTPLNLGALNKIGIGKRLSQSFCEEIQKGRNLS